MRLAYLTQEVRELERYATWRVIEAIEDVRTVRPPRDEGGQRLAARAAARLHRRPAADPGRRDLSGGERRRLQLTRLLMDEPNVLLLDEPTNDLDIETLTSLEDVLDGWAGTLVVVSHDRYLLERVCDRQVALLGDGRVRDLPGGVEQYLELRRPAAPTAAARGAHGCGARRRPPPRPRRPAARARPSCARPARTWRGSRAARPPLRARGPDPRRDGRSRPPTTRRCSSSTASCARSSTSARRSSSSGSRPPRSSAVSRPPAGPAVDDAGLTWSTRSRSGAGSRAGSSRAASAPASCSLRPDREPANRRSWSCSDRSRHSGCCRKVANRPSSPSVGEGGGDGLGADRPDELVLEVGVADEEPVPRQVGRPGDRVPAALQRADEEAGLPDVAEARHVGPGGGGLEPGEVAFDVGDALHGDDLDAGRLAGCLPVEQHPHDRCVAASLDEDDDAALRAGLGGHAAQLSNGLSRRRSMAASSSRSPVRQLGEQLALAGEQVGHRGVDGALPGRR